MQSSEEKFRFLRIRIQHEAAPQALVIVVGAAQPGDGATYVACGLARAFAEAGHRTLLLDANPVSAGIADELGITAVADASNPQRLDRNLSLASLYEREKRLVADDDLDLIIAGVRSRYAVTIVDASVIPGSGGALQLARIADGVLVAVRLGRHPCAADHEMKLLLQPDGVLGHKAFSGIVPTRATKRRIPRPKEATTSLPAVANLIDRFVGRVQTTGR